MSEKVRFIFSTRTLGSDRAFAKQSELTAESTIRKYLVNHFMSITEVSIFTKSPKDVRNWDRAYGDVRNWVKKYYDAENHELCGTNLKLFFGGNCAENLRKSTFESWYNNLIAKDKTNDLFNTLFDSRTVSAKIEHETSCCPGKEAYDRLTARFSYYCLSNPSTAEGIEAFAVPHLEWRADKAWIQALIEEKFDKEANDFNTLYLILHDNDVPGHEKTVFHFLTPKESKLLLMGKDKTNGVDEKTEDELEYNGKKIKIKVETIEKDQEKEEVLVYNDKKINIIVFQHTWNDAMAILTKSGIGLESIKRQFGVNKKIVNEIFNGNTDENKKKYFLELNCDAFVDLCQKDIDCEEKKNRLEANSLPSGKNYYVYNDNGALLTELMHVKIDASSAKKIVEFVKLLRAPAFEKDSLIDVDKMRFPLIIKLYKSFFDDWEKACSNEDNKKKIRNHRNRQALEENLDRVFSFFNNSSIWVRIVDVKDPEASQKAVDEFKYFDNIGLYSFSSAKENLEYGTRLFSQNYLDTSLGGHSNYVTPVLYGNEVESLASLKREYVVINPNQANK